MQIILHTRPEPALGRLPGRVTVTTLLAALLLAATPALSQSVVIPRLTEYVTDQTGTLAPEIRQELSDSLAAFDRQTSTQIVVVILPTIGIEAIEEVSLKIVETNNVGGKGKDNGVLLLVVRDDKLLRIEVGYGLEGVLTDALSAQIIRREIVPRFRNGDYAGGIVAGVSAIKLATRNEYTADPREDGKKGFRFSTLVVVLIILFIVSRMKFRSSGIGRGGFPPVPPFGGGWGGGGGFGGGGFGGSGGGGFSGGGGSFGGGGSSGSW